MSAAKRYDVVCSNCGEVFKENVTLRTAYAFIGGKRLLVDIGELPPWAANDDSSVYVESPRRDARNRDMCDHTDVAE